HEARTVVLGNKGSHARGQAVTTGQLEADADMFGDEAGTDVRLKLVVRVRGVDLVLDVVLGLRDLADVMKVAAHAHAHGISSDQVGCALGKVADDHAVVEGGGRLLLQVARERGSGVPAR